MQHNCLRKLHTESGNTDGAGVKTCERNRAVGFVVAGQLQ